MRRVRIKRVDVVADVVFRRFVFFAVLRAVEDEFLSTFARWSWLMQFLEGEEKRGGYDPEALWTKA